jgi:superoxide dismutase, Cu-Zn family
MKKQKILFSILSVIALVFIISAFSIKSGTSESKQEIQKITKAICVLYPTQGNQVTGIVTFTQMGNDIHVVADLHGLSKGKHGFHIHEFGDCSAPDGTSTGGHFNPDKMEHGGPMASMRHIGDMGNIVADADGNAHLDYMDSMISFEGKNSIIGRGIIVHASEDDLKTQPTGAAGARVAYGVIGIAKGE